MYLTRNDRSLLTDRPTVTRHGSIKSNRIRTTELDIRTEDTVKFKTHMSPFMPTKLNSYFKSHRHSSIYKMKPYHFLNPISHSTNPISNSIPIMKTLVHRNQKFIIRLLQPVHPTFIFLPCRPYSQSLAPLASFIFRAISSRAAVLVGRLRRRAITMYIVLREPALNRTFSANYSNSKVDLLFDYYGVCET